MVVIIFRTRCNSGFDAEMEQIGGRMYELATAMPGFISYKDFGAADGESVSLVEFESLETLAAWRDHPEHREAQRLGRAGFFAEYHIQVCAPLRESHFKAEIPIAAELPELQAR